MITVAHETGVVVEGDVLWEPSDQRREAAQLSHYRAWLTQKRALSFPDYAALHYWSVTEPESFWSSIWEYFQVRSEGTFVRAVDTSGSMFKARWFEGARVNFAEHLLRCAEDDPEKPALIHGSETRDFTMLTRGELADQVYRLAGALRSSGVKPGDRVISLMPNLPETAVAMIATVAIGAVWAAAAPEFGVRTVVERFGQIQPKVLFAADGYRFGGRDFDRRGELGEIASALPSLETIVWLPYLGLGAPPQVAASVVEYSAFLGDTPTTPESFRFERVTWDHPLWILFSSGTTGIPKAIVHSHVGVLVEHLKTIALHLDVNEHSRPFIFTSPGWMMWNMLVSSLLVGASAVLYDGSPTLDGPRTLWQVAERTRCTLFGVSPSFVQLSEKAGLRPGEIFDITAVQTLLLGGAPSGPAIYEWLYRNVKQDMWVCAPSGGTELVSALVSGNVTAAVRAGEIQAAALGIDTQVWNEAGRPVVTEVGELVVTRPFPSAPLFFWGDKDDRRYKESYFEHFPEVWRHGDIAKTTSEGGFYVYGRSDATLNRFGVRIGSGEVYSIVERLTTVRDSLVVCCDMPDGSYYMPLFVALAEASELTDEAIKQINERLRTEGSPRHVPDEIISVPVIPYTLTGKRMEVPVRKVLMGAHPDSVASRDAMATPGALDWFRNFALARSSYERLLQE
jgi:acetoacetyl-CoA synthetase